MSSQGWVEKALERRKFYAENIAQQLGGMKMILNGFDAITKEEYQILKDMEQKLINTFIPGGQYGQRKQTEESRTNSQQTTEDTDGASSGQGNSRINDDPK